MEETEINWGYNCLTQGVHHGRPEPIWNLPLFQAVLMFDTGGLQKLVLARIHNDAMQYVENNDDGDRITTPEWADKVAALADKKFLPAFTSKVDELQKYYDSPSWYRDINDAIDRFKEGKLNPNYKPLHPHDSINMLCRILGVDSSMEASK